MEYGVDPNAQDPDNTTALELARGSGIRNIVMLNSCYSSTASETCMQENNGLTVLMRVIAERDCNRMWFLLTCGFKDQRM